MEKSDSEIGNHAMKRKKQEVDTFSAYFSECSSHFCQVVLHPTVARLRSALKGLDSGKDLKAATVIHPDPRDSLLATIHLCREHLDCACIVHECLHAAWHRAKLLGIKHEDDFQEFVAYGQAHLIGQIQDWIDCQNQFLASTDALKCPTANPNTQIRVRCG